MLNSTSSTASHFLQNTLENGAIAAVATTAAAAICGAIEENQPLAPINSVSHILWGDAAANHNDLSAQYTATGLALNAAAVTAWAGIHEWVLSYNTNKRDFSHAMVSGAAVSGLAFVTDYYLVPKRFTPGFEKRLSNTSLLAIYSALAVSLAIGRCRAK